MLQNVNLWYQRQMVLRQCQTNHRNLAGRGHTHDYTLCWNSFCKSCVKYPVTCSTENGNRKCRRVTWTHENRPGTETVKCYNNSVTELSDLFSWARFKTRSANPPYNERREGNTLVLPGCVIRKKLGDGDEMRCCHLSAGRCCSVLLRVEQLVEQLFTLCSYTLSYML